MNYTHAGPSYGSKIFVWGLSCDASSTKFVSLGFSVHKKRICLGVFIGSI